MVEKELRRRKAFLTASGLGLIRVYQKASDEHKDVCLVLGLDGKGNIRRLGYRLKDKDVAEFPKKVNWFDRNEIEILIDSELEKRTGEVVVDVDIEFSPPKRLQEKGRELLLFFPNGESRFRNIIRFNKNKILEFVIQLEINVESPEGKKWRPAIRYNCAHGYIHRDLIYANGKREKARVETQVLKDAIPFIINDIKFNLGYWIKSLGYNNMSIAFSSWSTMDADFEDAQKYLLSLFENPERISQISSMHRIVGIKSKRENLEENP